MFETTKKNKGKKNLKKNKKKFEGNIFKIFEKLEVRFAALPGIL